MKISDLIKKIHNKSFLLPDIQRDYVWTEEQIINLFDSIMQDYPLGMILLWELQKEDAKGFYTFLESTTDIKKQYDGGSVELYAVLDGQQRLTSLYLATYGDYDGKKLYLNASYKDEHSEENVYEFSFKGEEDLKKYKIVKDGSHNDFAYIYNDGNNTWVKVSYMLEISENELEKLADDCGFTRLEDNNCRRLRERFEKKKIYTHIITKDNSDKALDIFVRVNSGGRKLEKSDLLFSLLVNKTKNLKSKIEELLSGINDEYKNGKFNSLNSLDKDVFLRTCLCIFAKSIKYNLKTFRETDIISQIENNFEKVEDSLKYSVKFLDKYCGYGKLKGLSFYPIVLVAFIMFNQKDMDKLIDSSEEYYKNLREELIKFIHISLIVGIYSTNSDTVLGQIRDVIKNNNYVINIDKINEVLSDNKKIILRDSKIDDILEKYKYTTQSHKSQMFFILSLLNPQIDIEAADYDIDHIYPKSICKNDIELKKLINSLGNTQLLFFRDNRIKSDECPLVWINGLEDYKRNRIVKGNLIDIKSLVDKNDKEGIKNFIKQRNKKIKKELKERFKTK